MEKFCKDLLTMVGQQQKIASFWEYIFLQKIIVGRESTSSQLLISFRKIQSCKLFLQAKGNLNNLVLIEEQKWCYEKLPTIRKNEKLMESFSICSKPTTPGIL